MFTTLDVPLPRAVARAILAGVVLLVWIVPSQTGTLYVSGIGSDTMGTGSQISPFRNIYRAHQAALDGDSILIIKGDYSLGTPLTKKVQVQALGGDVQVHLNNTPIVDVAPPLPSPGRPGEWIMVQAAARDDGLPAGGQLTFFWRVNAGPGSAEVASQDSPTARFRFQVPGQYAVQVLVSDGERTSVGQASVTVEGGTVDPPQPPIGVVNTAPKVTVAPQSQTVNVHNDALVVARVSDDGRPNPPGKVGVTWSQTRGPSGATFTDPTATNTRVHFLRAGIYEFQAVAYDGALSASNSLRITVLENLPPTITSISGPLWPVNRKSATLRVLATDDGWPKPPGRLAYRWDLVSGPGSATFSARYAEATVVTVSNYGQYRFRATVSDGQASDSRTILVQFRSSGLTAGLAGPEVLPTDDTAASVSLRLSRETPGRSVLVFRGLPDEMYQLERSTNLVKWETIQVVTGTEEPLELTDEGLPLAQSVFYRMVRATVPK